MNEASVTFLDRWILDLTEVSQSPETSSGGNKRRIFSRKRWEAVLDIPLPGWGRYTPNNQQLIQ